LATDQTLENADLIIENFSSLKHLINQN